jgi:hypothetical protein
MKVIEGRTEIDSVVRANRISLAPVWELRHQGEPGRDGVKTCTAKAVLCYILRPPWSEHLRLIFPRSTAHCATVEVPHSTDV